MQHYLKTFKALVIRHGPLVLLGLLPFGLFALFFHLEILDPTHIAWIMADHGPGANDWGQHALGWHAFRHDIWRWPFYEQKLLAYPTGLSVLYTDSNPLIAIPLKLFAPLLPEPFQYIGIWFLVCLILHIVFAWKLVRPYTASRWAALGGVVALSLLPAFYYRARHDNLMAHWLILWALHIYFNVTNERKKVIGWACCLTLSAMIHPYIMFMIMAIWAGDVIRILGPLVHPLDRESLIPRLRDQALIFSGLVAGLWYGGAFSGQSAGASGYGSYSMGLDAPINPVKPEFSFFIKANPLDAAQAFEGYQYLGFGLIVLIITACVLYFGFKKGRNPPAADTAETVSPQSVIARLKHLRWPLGVLLVIAVSYKVQLYDTLLFKVPLPSEALHFLAVFRASGRLFWPVSYGLVFLSVIIVYQTRLRTQAAILSAIVALQAIDLQGFVPFVRSQTKEARLEHNFLRTRSPQWEPLIAAAKRVDVYPPNVQMDEPLFYEIAWRAVERRIPVSSMYAARPNTKQIAVEYAQRRAFLSGQSDPDHLAVFFTRCDVPAPYRNRLRVLDGVLVLPPRGAQNLELDKPKLKTPLGTDELHFGWRDQGTCLLGPEWDLPDQDGGSWSDGEVANLNLPLKNISSARPYYLNMWLTSFYRARDIKLYANDRLIAQKKVPRKLTHYAFDIPHNLLRDKNLRLRFEISDPVSPREVNKGPEPYKYGLKLYMLKLANVRAEVDPELRGE
jgi:hypothetical protein